MCTYVNFKIHQWADSTQISAEKDIVRELVFMGKHNFNITSILCAVIDLRSNLNNVHIARIF